MQSRGVKNITNHIFLLASPIHILLNGRLVEWKFCIWWWFIAQIFVYLKKSNLMRHKIQVEINSFIHIESMYFDWKCTGNESLRMRYRYLNGDFIEAKLYIWMYLFAWERCCWCSADEAWIKEGFFHFIEITQCRRRKEFILRRRKSWRRRRWRSRLQFKR